MQHDGYPGCGGADSDEALSGNAGKAQGDYRQVRCRIAGFAGRGASALYRGTCQQWSFVSGAADWQGCGIPQQVY